MVEFALEFWICKTIDVNHVPVNACLSHLCINTPRVAESAQHRCVCVNVHISESRIFGHSTVRTLEPRERGLHTSLIGDSTNMDNSRLSRTWELVNSGENGQHV